MLQSLRINSFRGFGELTLEGLSRVNLIVGKNNTGKTSFLEAVTLLANPSMVDKLPGLFRANQGLVAERFYPWLFKDKSVTMTTLFATIDGQEQKLLLLPQGANSAPEFGNYVYADKGVELWTAGVSARHRVHAVSVQHRGPDSMVDSFAEAVRSPADEKAMEELLAAVDPRVSGIRLDAVGQKPFIVVDVGLSQRVPLAQAGQGLYRLVSMFSELLGAKVKVCVIDEVENGIHYSAMTKVWDGIGEVADRLDVQVFATTHSWECLIAAHEAFATRPTYELRVIQLFRLGDNVSGRVLDRPHIEAAIKGDIELR